MGLPDPVTPDGVAGLQAILGRPHRALLAFDFDGVLSPIVADPEQSSSHPKIIPALGRLAVIVGSLAIITGRPAADVIRLGGFEPLVARGQLAVFGLYGQQRWDPDRQAIVSREVPPGVAAARAELAALLDDVDATAGVTVEDKGGSFAVHTRRAREPDRALAALRAPLADLADRHALALEPGRLVLELRPPGIDKGHVLTEHLRERALAVVGYFGDDLGDLAAFAAVDALRQQGVPGIKVCSGSDEAVEVARQADLVLDGPRGVAAFLLALADELNGPHAGRG